MSNNPYAAYVENSVLSASPVEIVRMLYEAAIEAIREARARLARGDIRGRSANITRAVEILAELSGALDHGQGGELSVRLAALYDYAQRRLLQANYEQADAPLAEVAGLLETVLEGWKQVAAVPAATQPAADASGWAIPPAEPGGYRLDLTL